MREVPDTNGPDHYRELLDLKEAADSAGLGHQSGYAVERRPTPVEHCRWPSCREALYGPQERRADGKPRRYCAAHKKPRKTRLRALERRGIHVGRHRNLTYDFPGNEGQELDDYRAVWANLNLPCP